MGPIKAVLVDEESVSDLQERVGEMLMLESFRQRDIPSPAQLGPLLSAMNRAWDGSSTTGSFGNLAYIFEDSYTEAETFSLDVLTGQDSLVALTLQRVCGMSESYFYFLAEIDVRYELTNNYCVRSGQAVLDRLFNLNGELVSDVPRKCHYQHSLPEWFHESALDSKPSNGFDIGMEYKRKASITLGTSRSVPLTYL